MPQIARLGETFGDRQPRAGVTAVEDIVGRFRPPREPADAVERPKRPEPLETPGEQLVGVGLVSRIPDDPVAGRLEQPMQRDGQLDDTERRTKVTAGDRDGMDDGLADLGRQLSQLVLVHAAQFGRAVEFGQEGHGRTGLRMAVTGTAGSVGLTLQVTRL